MSDTQPQAMEPPNGRGFLESLTPLVGTKLEKLDQTNFVEWKESVTDAVTIADEDWTRQELGDPHRLGGQW